MKYIVTGLEKKTVLLWHPDSSTSVELGHPHVIPSKALPKKTSTGKSASDVRKVLKEKGIDFKERKLTSGKVIIQAIGPPEMKKEMSDLKDEFPSIRKNDGRNNVSQLRKMRIGWPFCYADVKDGKPTFTKKTPSIDELCDLPFDAFDSAFEGWEREIDFEDLKVSEKDMREYLQVDGMTRKELVKAVCEKKLQDPYEAFAVCLVTSGQSPNFYFTKYKMADKRDEVFTSFGSHMFENIVVEKIEDMNSAFQQILETCDEKKKEQLQQYFDEGKEKVKTPADAMTFLFAITKRTFNAFSTGGHNISSYDYPNMRGELKKTTFLSGIGGRPPKHDANLKFFHRYIEPGRHSLDTCQISQKYLAGTVNNKLVTAIRHILGVDEGKSQTYEETTKCRIESFFGNTKSAKENADYCKIDTIWHYELAKAVQRPIFLISQLVKQAPEVVASTSSNNIAEKLLQMRSFAKTGGYVDNRFGDFENAPPGAIPEVRNPSGQKMSLRRTPYQGKKDQFDVEKEKNLLLQGLTVKDEQLRKALKNKMTNEEADVFYLTPYVAAFSHFVDKNPQAKAILDEIEQLNTSGLEDRIVRNSKLILAQGLQRDWLAKLIHTTLNYSPSRGHMKMDKLPYEASLTDAYIFEQLFGIPLHELNNSINETKKKFQEALMEFDAEIIDSAKLTAIRVSDYRRQDFIQFLEENRLGYHYAQARVISSSKSKSFLMDIDGDIMTQGIDVNYTRGLRNAYDRKFMKKFLHLTLKKGNYTAAAQLIEDTVDQLRGGNVPIDQLMYITDENKRDSVEYSARSWRNRTIREKIFQDAKKGKLFAWAYTEGGTTAFPEVQQAKPDHNMYLKIMFGDSGVRNYTYVKDGKEAKSTTSVGALVETVLVCNTDNKAEEKRKRAALKRLVNGNRQGDEIDILGNNYKQQELF